MAAEELGHYGSPESRENTHICVETRADREENVAWWNYPSTLSQIQLQVPAPSLSEERHLVVETKPRPPTTLCVSPLLTCLQDEAPTMKPCMLIELNRQQKQLSAPLAHAPPLTVSVNCCPRETSRTSEKKTYGRGWGSRSQASSSAAACREPLH